MRADVEIKRMDLNKYKKLMIVAHPDDESLWGGNGLYHEKYLVVCMTCGVDEKRVEELLGRLSLKEKIEFYKRKWLKEHITIMVFVGICIMGIMISGIVTRHDWLIVLAGLLIPIAHGWRNNAMMTYVERNAYDG